MTETLAKLPNEPITLEGLVKRSAFADRFKEVLGAKAPQFMSSLLAVGKTMPDVEPRSIIAAAMNAAILDLPIDKNLGLAWIVPYRQGDRKYAQFQMGYKGFIQLALRSGCYAGMNAAAVNAEVFTGYNALGFAKLDWDQFDPEKPVAGYAFAFALANTPNCAWTFYWSKKRMQDHAKRYSQAYRKGEGTWVTNPERMGIKTVVKNELAHWGILSIDFQRALLADQSVAIDVESAVTHPDNDLLMMDKGAGGEPEPGEPEPQKEKKTRGKKAAQESATIPQPPPEPTTPAANPSLVVAGGPTDAEIQQDVARLREITKTTPQQELAEFVIKECGSTLDTFLRWGDETGNIIDASSIASFDDVPTPVAKRLLIAKTGLMRGLKSV